MIDNDDRAGFDPKVMIDAFNASAQEMRDQHLIVMREMMQTQGRALEFESFTVNLQAGQVTQLVGFDLSRMKTKLHAHGAGVYVGKREGIATAGQGYRLPSGSDVEFAQVDELYAMLTPTYTIANLFTGGSLVPNFPFGSGTPVVTVGPEARFPSGTAAKVSFSAAPATGFGVQFNGSSARIVGGQQYTVSAYGSPTWAGATYQLFVNWRDASGNSYSSASGSTGAIAANAVTPYSFTVTAPIDAVQITNVSMQVSSAAATAADTFSMGSFMIKPGAVAGPYVDRNSLGVSVDPDGTVLQGMTTTPVSVWVEKNAQ